MIKVAAREQTPTQDDLLSGYSLEISAKEEGKLDEIVDLLPPGAVVSITFLPNETMDMRVAAAVRLRRLGLTPMPHLSARRLTSADELRVFLARLAGEAAIDRVFVVAGDCDAPQGPFEDALGLIRDGELAANGVKFVGIGGYPEGHPAISQDKLQRALIDKTAHLAAHGLDCEIITQFSFDAAPVLTWLRDIRAQGVQAPVRIGLPGPANVATLLRFAARCGVGASAKVMAKYGVSITRVLNSAGPDRLIADLSAGLSPAVHGQVRAHFYPFGGLAKTAEWARARHAQSRSGR
jgi:methylenetetrahydrofolate reductase (NADPH)